MVRRALVPLLLALACSRSSPPAVESSGTAAGVPAAEPAAELAPPPAQPAPPPAPEHPVHEAVELPPGDPVTPSPLNAEAETVVDPGASFRVVLAGTCRDARLMLLDGAGAAIPAAETVEVGPTTVLTLAPSTALTPGSRYQLRLDGATGRELHLSDRGYPPVRYALRAAGEPPPPPRAVPKKRGKRR